MELLLRIQGPQAREFVMRFQQVTAAAMAKGVEDTAFYCFSRLLSLNETNDTDYVDHRAITEELVHMRKLCARHNWPIIDVTRRSIEETAAAVINLLQEIGQGLRNDPQFRDDIVADPQVPGIERVSGGEVDYLMLVKTRPGRQYAVSRELRRRIKECFEKNNIQAGNPARVYVLPGSTPQP